MSIQNQIVMKDGSDQIISKDWNDEFYAFHFSKEKMRLLN